MKLYRYEDRVYSSVSFDPGGGEHYHSTPVQIEHMEFEVVKETRCGYWINFGGRKWVSKTSRKRFAHVSRLDAMKSFIRRKERQVTIYSTKLDRAQQALSLARDSIKGDKIQELT